ncbi:DUF7373 family lipoprotein [Nocardia sp. NBC_00403]|uniref:DUF7373 family lipoprotein n=1 Tax=Nocardia sp. NBC_00403 TaxID=2975990 RepID=UPI003FA54F69
MRSRHIWCVIMTAAIGISAGCGDGDNDTATRTIDAAALDSGNYATVPRDIEASRTEISGARQEAIRIGNATPLPADVDGKFAFKTSIYWDRRITPGDPTALPSLNSRDFNDLTPGFIAGWESRGQRREQVGLGTVLDLYTLRFENAALAQAAAARIADRQQESSPGEAIKIPERPDARAKWNPKSRYLDSQLVAGPILLLVHVDDPVSEPVDTARLVDLTQQTFSKQIEGLKGYTPTPVDQLRSLPLDVEGLLSRTLPLDDQGKPTDRGDLSMVMPRQAALHTDHYPNLTKAAFDDAGVDLVAFSGGQLYRTRDTESPERLIAAFIDQEAKGYKAIEGPPHMSGVKCFDTKDPKTSKDRYSPVCYFGYDRYAARVQTSSVQQLYQRTAAQYKLLAYGH